MSIKSEFAFWFQVTGIPQAMRAARNWAYDRWQKTSLVRRAASEQRYRHEACDGQGATGRACSCVTCSLRDVRRYPARYGLRLDEPEY